MRFLLAVVAVALVSACASPPYEIKAPFDPAEFAIAEQTGTGVIEGQAFMRQRGGGVVTAAGNEVVLVPANRYTEEMARAVQMGLQAGGWANLVPEYHLYTRAEIAGVDGDFRFENVPAGDWIIATQVMWSVPLGGYYSSIEGGSLVQKISLSEGEIERVILSR